MPVVFLSKQKLGRVKGPTFKLSDEGVKRAADSKMPAPMIKTTR
jgi:hypothetical protein